MNDIFEKQYNKSAKVFNDFYLNQEAHQSTDAFFESISPAIFSEMKNKKVLDLGCGAGADAQFYTKHGCQYYGIDTSSEMCLLAKNNSTVVDIKNESFSKTISHEDKKFGMIVSKYAMQTARKVQPIYNEAYRMLDDHGYFIFLIVHPMRQFLEKKKSGKNYFDQEFVESIIFNGKITVTEPTHTLSEYLSADFLKKFSLINIKEGYDFPNSEQIGGDIYPTYLIITARKK